MPLAIAARFHSHMQWSIEYEKYFVRFATCSTKFLHGLHVLYSKFVKHEVNQHRRYLYIVHKACDEGNTSHYSTYWIIMYCKVLSSLRISPSKRNVAHTSISTNYLLDQSTSIKCICKVYKV